MPLLHCGPPLSAFVAARPAGARADEYGVLEAEDASVCAHMWATRIVRRRDGSLVVQGYGSEHLSCILQSQGQVHALAADRTCVYWVSSDQAGQTQEVRSWSGNLGEGQVLCFGNVTEWCGSSCPLVPWPVLPKVQAVACGAVHAAILCEEGSLFTVGHGGAGQLGLGTAESYSQPQRVEALVGIVVAQVICGSLHTLARTCDGDLYSWGSNAHSQLGRAALKRGEEPTDDEDDMRVGAFVPGVVDFGEDACPLVAVAAGSAHSAAVDSRGRAYTWGWGKYGQLGHRGDLSDCPSPRLVDVGDLMLAHNVWAGAGSWHTSFLLSQSSSFSP